MIEDALADAVLSANGWYRATCPMCATRKGTTDKRKSLGINGASGVYHCFRCNAVGRLNDFEATEWANAAAAVTTGVPSTEAFQAPDGFVQLSEGDGAEALSLAPARDYLARRKVVGSTVFEVGIGACVTGKCAGRIVVPVRVSGHWVGWVARAWSSDPRITLRYLYPKGMDRELAVFNRDALAVECDEPVAIVEGVFDALPHWPLAVACLGKPTHAHFEMLAECKRPLVIALDGDAWEEGLALALRLRLAGKQAGVLKMPPARDPGVAPRQWFREKVYEAWRTELAESRCNLDPDVGAPT